MNIHDDSQRKALAFVIVIGLIFAIFLYVKFTYTTEQKTIQVTPAITMQPVATTTIDTPFTSPKSEAEYFEKEANKIGDIYTSRYGFISKMKGIDKWLDFSRNYDQDSNTVDNTLSGDDKYGLSVQIIGSKKHVKQISFTYFPNAIYGIRTYTLDDISKGVKIICKQSGENWSSLHMGKILIEPDISFKDSVIISSNKLIWDYQAEGQSIDITITHQ